MNFKHFLIIRTDRFGDMLMTVPIVRRIRSNFPSAQITFLCQEVNEPLLYYHFDITKVESVRPDHARGSNVLKFISRIRSLKPDCIIMPQSDKIYHLAAFLSGAKKRIGFDRKWGFLLTDRIPDDKASSGRHEIDSNMKLLDGICRTAWDGSTDLGYETCSQSEQIFRKIILKEGKINIAFHLGSSNPEKFWPVGSFKKVLDEFLRQSRYQVVLIGADEGRDLAGELGVKDHPGVVNLIGKTNFSELALVLGRMDCLVSLDSGPYHLAWMQGVPVVGIFIKGATGSNPKRWGVYPNSVLNCQFFDTAQNITPSMVTEAIKEILNRKKEACKEF